MTLRLKFSLLVFSVLIFSSLLSAQPLTEPLEKWQFETGYSHYWFKGEFYWNQEDPSSDNWWSTGTFYFRSGVYNIITLSIEGMAWPVSSSSNYPGESFINFNLGFGISSPTIKLLIFKTFLNFHYLENLYLDNSEQSSDKRFRTIQIGTPIRLQIMKSFNIWTAPVYIWKSSEFFELQTYSRSSDFFGISIGLDAMLYKHIYLKINTTYTDYFQPQVTAGYRF